MFFDKVYGNFPIPIWALPSYLGIGKTKILWQEAEQQAFPTKQPTRGNEMPYDDRFLPKRGVSAWMDSIFGFHFTRADKEQLLPIELIREILEDGYSDDIDGIRPLGPRWVAATGRQLQARISLSHLLRVAQHGRLHYRLRGRDWVWINQGGALPINIQGRDRIEFFLAEFPPPLRG